MASCFTRAAIISAAISVKVLLIFYFSCLVVLLPTFFKQTHHEQALRKKLLNVLKKFKEFDVEFGLL
jgi:hypothetical protein